MGVVSIWSTL